ncbi:hypothetical protein KEJ21_00740 [Candidatus Bathyarchaeota archaeon]|nr:hypothetical protein [Candidatus Bathyarchaeota archaeon]MBS7631630.1 hypothetical protein [Candidatus Bathyarchaeota archaeon]
MQKRQKIIAIGVVIVFILALGGVFLRNATKEKPKVSFTKDSLSSLESKLESLSIEELEGLSEGSSLNVSSQNLEQLSLNIEGLEFDDLEGLSSP